MVEAKHVPAAPARSPIRLVLAGLVLAAMTPFAVMSVWPKTTATQEELQGYAATLERAIKYGDRAAAESLYRPLADRLQALNDDPDSERSGSPQHYCRLAALHVVRGVEAVHSGVFVWLGKPQFEAAMSHCR